MKFTKSNYNQQSFASFRTCSSELTKLLIENGMQKKDFFFNGHLIKHVRSQESIANLLFSYEFIADDLLYRASNFWSNYLYSGHIETTNHYLNQGTNFKLNRVNNNCHWKIFIDNEKIDFTRNKGCDFLSGCTPLSSMA